MADRRSGHGAGRLPGHGWACRVHDDAEVRGPNPCSTAAFGQPSMHPTRVHMCQARPHAATAMLCPRHLWAWRGRLNGSVLKPGRRHQGAVPSALQLRGGGCASGWIRAALTTRWSLLPLRVCMPLRVRAAEGGGGGGRWLHGRLTGWMLAAGDAQAAPWARRRQAAPWAS